MKVRCWCFYLLKIIKQIAKAWQNRIGKVMASSNCFIIIFHQTWLLSLQGQTPVSVVPPAGRVSPDSSDVWGRRSAAGPGRPALPLSHPANPQRLQHHPGGGAGQRGRTLTLTRKTRPDEMRWKLREGRDAFRLLLNVTMIKVVGWRRRLFKHQTYRFVHWCKMSYICSRK